MIRFDNLPPEVMQAMCTPMHQVLAPVPIPPSASPPSSHAHSSSYHQQPSSPSAYAYASSPSSPYSTSPSSPHQNQFHQQHQPPHQQQTQQYSGALYIGSMSAIHDKDLLREHRITHLVQVLDVPWLPTEDGGGGGGGGGGGRGGARPPLSTHRIPILDSHTADLKPHLEAACAYIDRALRTGSSVLVHCQQGISRSAAVTIAYLIWMRGMSYEDAFGLVRKKRACIKPNAGFVKALKEWELVWRRPAMGGRRFTT